MTDDVLQLAAGGRLTVDLTAIQANYRALAGLAPSSVELLGPNQGLAEVADTAGTIPYEILTGRGRRFHRSYVEGPALMKSPTRCRAS